MGVAWLQKVRLSGYVVVALHLNFQDSKVVDYGSRLEVKCMCCDQVGGGDTRALRGIVARAVSGVEGEPLQKRAWKSL